VSRLAQRLREERAARFKPCIRHPGAEHTATETHLQCLECFEEERREREVGYEWEEDPS